MNKELNNYKLELDLEPKGHKNSFTNRLVSVNFKSVNDHFAKKRARMELGRMSRIFDNFILKGGRLYGVSINENVHTENHIQYLTYKY